MEKDQNDQPECDVKIASLVQLMSLKTRIKEAYQIRNMKQQ